MVAGTTSAKRALPSGLPAMVLVACVSLIVIFGYAPDGPPPVRTSVVASVPLTDDDGGAALFATGSMVPGTAPAQRCLTVSYAGEPSVGTIYLAATGVSGSLQGHLQLKVERGTGGSFDDCTGFTASATVFDGTLADLKNAGSDVPETSTGWNPATDESRTFRFSVKVQDVPTAQGQSAAGTFEWILVPDPTAPTTAAPTTAVPTTEPTQPAVPDPPAESPQPPAQPEPVVPAESPATDRPTTGAPVVPVASPTGPADGPTASPQTSPAPGTVTSPRSSRSAAAPLDPQAVPATPAPRGGLANLRAKVAAVAKAIGAAAKRAGDLAVRTGQDGALPATGMGVLLAFLAMQNQIDRRDPKLSMAPVTADYLEFLPPDEGGPHPSAGDHAGPDRSAT